MPTLNLKDGRKISIPDNYTQADIDAAMQGSSQPPSAASDDGMEGVTPWTEQASASATPADNGMEGVTPWKEKPLARAGGASNQQAELDQMRQSEANQLPWYQQLAIGSGQAAMSTVHGAGQIYDYLRHGADSPEYKKDLADEAERRQIDKAILNTGWGRTGQIGTHIGTALLPAAGAAKVASLGGAGLTALRLAAAEGAVGAGQGALQPVTQGESRGTNAAVSGALGTAAAVPGAVTRGLAAIVAPKFRFAADAIRSVARSTAPEVTETAKQAAARALAKRTIGEVTDNAKYPAQSLVRALRQHPNLPPAYNQQIAKLTNLAGSKAGNPRISGQQMQQWRATTLQAIRGLETKLRTGSGTPQEIVDAAMQKKALEQFQRQLDEGVFSSLPSKDVSRLKQAYTTIRTGEGPLPPITRQQALRVGALPATATGLSNIYQTAAPNAPSPLAAYLSGQ